MSTLDELLAEPVDEERRRVHRLPPVVFGVLLPVETPCGTVSRSARQTSWAVQRARRLGPQHLEHLTDADVLWLLVNAWEPPPWETWIKTETIGGSRLGMWPLVVGVLALAFVVAVYLDALGYWR
jgi:hypothetical protein